MVTYSGKVLYSSTADKNNTVLLEIMSFVGNIGDDFYPSGQAYFSDFSDGRIGFLWRTRHHLHTNPAPKGVVFQGWRLAFRPLRFARFAHKLINSRHETEKKWKAAQYRSAEWDQGLIFIPGAWPNTPSSRKISVCEKKFRQKRITSPFAWKSRL